MKIRELIARRTDLSTFLVHLCRDEPELSAIDKLKRILESETVRAGKALGPAVKKLEDAGLQTESQKVVCFSEVPLEYVYLLTGEIEGRQQQFEPYGVALTKAQGRQWGLNPIWYLDMTPGQPNGWLSKNID